MKINKLMKVALAATISSVLLTGCFSSEKDDVLNAAKSSYAAGDYEKAREHFEKAIRIGALEQSDSENIKPYQETLNKLYVKYYTDGMNLVESKSFDEALASYEKAWAISTHDPKLNQKIKEVKPLIEEQKKFDDYISFVNSIFKDSNTILREFNKNVDSLVVGSMTEKEFNNKVKLTIPKSNEIISELDNYFTAVDGDLTNIHQELLSLVEYQHKTFVIALEGDNSSVLSSRYIEIKKKQTGLVNKLQSYANQKKIKYSVAEKAE